MKNKWKLIALCFLILLSMIGCGNKPSKNEDVAMGRFIEQAIKIDEMNAENNIFMTQTRSGKINIIEGLPQGELAVYEEDESGHFIKIEPKWANEVNKYAKDRWVMSFDLDENDQPFFSVLTQVGEADTNEHSTENTRTTIYYFDKEQIKSCELKVEGGLPYVIPTRMALINGEKIVLAGQYFGQCAYDLKTGELINNYSSGSGSFFEKDEQLYTLDLDENKIVVFNADNNEVIKEIPCEAVDYCSMITPGEEGSVYLVTRNGIWQYRMDDSTPIMVMDGNGTSLKLPSHATEKAYVEDGKIIVLQSDDQYRSLLRSYSYSETTPTLPTVELNAYTLESNNTFLEYISNYQLAHPDIRINVQIGMTEENGVSRKEAISALNTEILAGSGPDIIALDGLQINTYLSKDLFVDLADIQKDAIFPFAMTPYIKDGHTYAIPLKFEVPVLLGEKRVLDAVHSIEELDQYMKAHANEKVISPDYVEVVANRIVPSYQEEWINSEGLQKDKLIHFLEVVKEMIIPDAIPTIEEYWDKAPTSIVSDGLCDMVFKDYAIHQGNMGTIEELLCANAANTMKENCELHILQSNGKTFCMPRCSIAITKSSKNKEAALEVLQFMLEKETQIIDTKEGYPVNKAAFDSWMSGEPINKNMYYSFGGRDENGEEYVIEYTWENEEAINAFKDKVYQIEEAKVVDMDLMNRVVKEALPYFEGKLTDDEVIEKVDKEIALYMQEQ